MGAPIAEEGGYHPRSPASPLSGIVGNFPAACTTEPGLPAHCLFPPLVLDFSSPTPGSFLHPRRPLGFSPPPLAAANRHPPAPLSLIPFPPLVATTLVKPPHYPTLSHTGIDSVIPPPP